MWYHDVEDDIYISFTKYSVYSLFILSYDKYDDDPGGHNCILLIETLESWTKNSVVLSDWL